MLWVLWWWQVSNFLGFIILCFFISDRYSSTWYMWEIHHESNTLLHLFVWFHLVASSLCLQDRIIAIVILRKTLVESYGEGVNL